MNIKYNNIDAAQAHGLVTFSDIPAILEVSDTTGGTRATLQLTVNSTWTATSNNQYWLTFQGNTISNVIDPQNAVNKNFYVASDKHSIAVSIANALRNCPTVVASFLVYADNDKVIAKAREIGAIDMSVTMSSNLSYISTATTAGTASSSLVNSKITVDVTSNGDYVTTLEKNYQYDKCRFDMTPVLATMAQYNKTVPYSLQISSMNASGSVSTLGSVTGNSVSVGYPTNQGDYYLTVNDNIFIAQNVSRGKLRDAYNSSLLYVYDDTISISFYTTSTGNVTATTTYRNSAYGAITSSTETKTIVGDGLLHTITIDLDIPNDCFYVDIQLNNLQKLRYDVIRPMKTSYGCQRVYWINSYGGTSFFDFVGDKTETRELEVVTYNKNNLDYYTNDVSEKEIPYDSNVSYSVTIKSHLLEKDGTYLFNDLMRSPNVWTEVNGTTYRIIIDSLTIDEQNNQGIYVATMKYHYSVNPL